VHVCGGLRCPRWISIAFWSSAADSYCIILLRLLLLCSLAHRPGSRLASIVGMVCFVRDCGLCSRVKKLIGAESRLFSDEARTTWRSQTLFLRNAYSLTQWTCCPCMRKGDWGHLKCSSGYELGVWLYGCQDEYIRKVRTLHNSSGSNESFDLGTALSADPHLDACEENLMLPDPWVVSFLVSGVRNSVAVLKQFIHWCKQDVYWWGQSAGYDALLQLARMARCVDNSLVPIFTRRQVYSWGCDFATPGFIECELAMGADNMVELASCAQSLIKKKEVCHLYNSNFCCYMRRSEVLDVITKEAWLKVWKRFCPDMKCNCARSMLLPWMR
jgi:hypothetical protein